MKISNSVTCSLLFVLLITILFVIVAPSQQQAPTTRPVLPLTFRVTLSFTLPSSAFTMSYQEYYDGPSKRFRIDSSFSGTRHMNLWNLQKKRYYDINRTMRTCDVYDSNDYVIHQGAGQVSPVKNGTNQLFSPKELFQFDDDFVYNGTDVIRGVTCEVYRRDSTNFYYSPEVVFNGTQIMYFSIPDWTFMGKNITRIPLRSRTIGTIKFSDPVTRNVTIVPDISTMVDFTDFNTDVPEDVFEVPSFCVDQVNPVPVPNFESGSFIASLQINHRKTKKIVLIDEYWDTQNQLVRINSRSGSESNTTIGLGAKKQLFVMGSNRTKCAKEDLSTDFAQVGGLFSVKQLFKMDTRYDEVYKGQQMVHEINCDHWVAVQTLSDGRNYTVERFFSADEWNTDGTSDVIPTRIIVVGTDADGNDIDVAIDVTKYLDISPDPDMFEVPSSCPGYLIYTTVRAYNAAGIGFLCLFIGLIFGAIAGAGIIYLVFVKKVCNRISKGGNIQVPSPDTRGRNYSMDEYE